MADPPRRVENVEINQVPDGYVVYDKERDRVHYLNHTAALVLEFCTGDNSVEDIVGIMQTAYELSDPPEQEIAECLQQLRDEGLVE